MQKVRKLVKALSKAEQMKLFEFLRDDEGLKAYRSLCADVDRAQQNHRERIIKRKALSAEHARNGREIRRERERRLSRKTGPLRSYSMAEFIEE